MSTALYRRYRPETFAEVIGQEHVTEPLITALTNNRVNHAYLFSGPHESWHAASTVPKDQPPPPAAYATPAANSPATAAAPSTSSKWMRHPTAA